MPDRTAEPPGARQVRQVAEPPHKDILKAWSSVVQPGVTAARAAMPVSPAAQVRPPVRQPARTGGTSAPFLPLPQAARAEHNLEARTAAVVVVVVAGRARTETSSAPPAWMQARLLVAEVDLASARVLAARPIPQVRAQQARQAKTVLQEPMGEAAVVGRVAVAAAQAPPPEGTAVLEVQAA